MEAFLSTGENVFPLEALAECYFPVGDKGHDGQVVRMSRGNLINDNGRITFYNDYSGKLKVFKKPDPRKKMQYVIGCDPSRTTYGDPACIQVLNRTTMEQVATWRGHAIDGDMAELLMLLGYWYNNAVINVEVQGGGQGVIAILLHRRYPHLWRWRKPDRIMGKLGNVYGWVTNMNTKPWGIGSLQHYLTKREMKLHDEITVSEMMEYTMLDGVEMGPASNNGTDDTVMALMIALMTNLTEDAPDLGEMYGMDLAPVPAGRGGYDPQEEWKELD
jgi:hypothetical protein